MRLTRLGRGDLVILDPKGQIRTGLLHAGIVKRLGRCLQLRSGFCVCSFYLYLLNITSHFGLAFERKRSCPRSELGRHVACCLTASFFAHSCCRLPSGAAFVVVLSLMCTQATLGQTISASRLAHCQCLGVS